MAINTLEMAKIFQQSLDKQMGIEATSGWMESNAVNVKYNGGDTVRMPRISTTGMARYDRGEGFNQGSVTLSYDDYKLTQDRGRTFQLDSMDVDESNFIASAGTVMGEFQRLHVVPEVDAYRYSRIAALAKNAHRTTDGFTPSETNILAQIDKEITDLQDAIGETEQEAGGFKADTTAKSINWIIISRRAPIAISKTDKVRIFAPDVNQKADAWKLDYRKFHDIWIPTNKLAGVWANIGA